MAWSATGANIRGPVGPTGPQGATGATGPQGPQGDAGPAGGAADIASETTSSDAKTTPVDADELPLVDSEASLGLKKLTWSNLKAALKTYFDSVTTTLTGKTISAGILSGATVLPQSGTITIYNTADQVTNYERTTFRWNSNAAEIGNFYGGTGSAVRPLVLGVASGAGSNVISRGLVIQNQLPYVYFGVGGSASASTASGAALIRFGNPTAQLTATSNHQTVFSVAGNIGQSGTASYTGFLIDITETSTGSGNKNLILAQVGGAQRFLVDNLGNVTCNNLFPGAISGAGNITPTIANNFSVGTASLPWNSINATTINATTTLTVNSVAVPTISSSSTLTNKSISGSSNTLTNISVGSLAATGTADATTYLRGDGSWAELDLAASAIDGGSAASTSADIIDGGTA